MDKLKIKHLNLRKVAILIAQYLFDKKGVSISVLDVRKLTAVTDFLILCTGNSDLHMVTLRQTVATTGKENNLPLLHRDGESSRYWQAMDFGGIIVHIFNQTARDFYQLDRLWGEARKVRWQVKSPP